MSDLSNWYQTWQNRRDKALQSTKKQLRQLRNHRGTHLHRLAAKPHERVIAPVDCLQCAGCCKGIPPLINATDARRIAKKLGLSNAEFQNQYLTTDEDGDTVLQLTPCPFLLDNNHCSIYDFRPKACREYPHTDQQFSKNLPYHVKNTAYCPASFWILEELKHRISAL